MGKGIGTQEFGSGQEVAIRAELSLAAFAASNLYAGIRGQLC